MIVPMICSVCIFIFCSFIFCGCTADNIYDGELLRLHIRANSDSDADQAVKLKVRDAVNAFIVSNITADTFDEAYESVGARLEEFEAVAENVLIENGFGYGARVRLTNEYFPTRRYGDVTVPDGNYDALMIELGSGKGANWWCVVYPPLCYGDQFEYKSFFAELFADNR